MNEDNINNTRDMTENNRQAITVKSYEIENCGDDIYSVTIKTDVHTLFYPKARIVFGVSELIAFPVRIQILNDDNEQIFNYSLNLAVNDSNEDTDQDISEKQ